MDDGRGLGTPRVPGRLVLHLLGRPFAERTGSSAYRFRSRKSWAVLGYLLLTDRQPTRAELAGLFFGEAQDPLAALRWSLAEIRRCLGDDGSVGGDPVVLALAGDVVVDAHVLERGSWSDAVVLPGLGADLLEGTALDGTPAFDAWLLSEQRRGAAATGAGLHGAGPGRPARGGRGPAAGGARRAA